jgi:hypothetical protein
MLQRDPCSSVRRRDSSANWSTWSPVRPLVAGLFFVSLSIPSGALAAGPLFQDGFESGNLSNWTASAGFVVQNQLVLGGSWAGRATSTGAAAYVYKSLAAAQSDLYLDAHFDLVSAVGTVVILRFRGLTGKALVSLQVTGKGYLSLVDSVSSTTKISAMTVSKGVWHEAQLHATINGASSLAEVSFDGNPVADVSGTVNLGTTAIGRVQLGPNGTSKGFDVAFDDAVATTTSAADRCEFGQTYSPDRFVLLDPSSPLRTATAATAHEPLFNNDGDWHVPLNLSPADAALAGGLSSFNTEIMPADKSLPLPRKNDLVTVTGVWVLDGESGTGHNELHPAQSVSILNRGIYGDKTLGTCPSSGSLATPLSIGIKPPVPRPVIDGTLDPIWSSAARYEIGQVVQGTVSYGVKPPNYDLGASFSTLWDANNLYVMVQVIDATQLAGDGVELLIDGDNNKSSAFDQNDFHYQLGWGSQAITESVHGATSGVVLAQGLGFDPKKNPLYSIEFAIPWSTLRVSPTIGNSIGFEVRVDDADGGGAPTHGTLAWWQPGAWARDPMPAPTQPNPLPSDFGTLLFQAQP